MKSALWTKIHKGNDKEAIGNILIQMIYLL